MGAHAKKSISAESVRLPEDSIFRKLPIIGLILAVVGLGGTLAMTGDAGHGYYAYLTAFLFFLSIALGGLFFVMIFFLTRSGWNVAIRRLGENIAMTVPVFVLLFVPLMVVGMETMYHWADTEHVAHDPILLAKAPYLNSSFFWVRAVIYFAIWTGLAFFFWKQSTSQDESGDHRITRRLQALAAPGIALGALSTTFAAFDWNMSLDAHWFSTMYGVIFFAGGFMGLFATLALLLVYMNKQNMLGGAATVEHYHGVGKMMWGMMCFWAYVSFSQFLLIWYGNIPEETIWFEHRWEGTWQHVSLFLLLGHFIIPFFAGMSMHIKRNPTTLAALAGWLLFMHYVDLYWMVMPNTYHGNASFGLLEIFSFVGVGGAFIAAFSFLLQRNLLVPVKDPRLPESLAYTN